MKNKYLICNIGCDDSNNFEMELTKQERDILIKVFEEKDIYRQVREGCVY